MTLYSQNDPSWRSLWLGSSVPKTTIGKDGCLLTCFAMMSNTAPPQANQLIKSSGGFQGALIINAKAAQTLNLGYDPSTTERKFSICVAETNHYEGQGYPSHFYILLEDDSIWDPLDGTKKPKNYYNIKSYRNIKPKEDEMSEDNKLAILFPVLCERWETWHGKKLDEAGLRSVEGEGRRIIRGELNETDLFIKWVKGE